MQHQANAKKIYVRLALYGFSEGEGGAIPLQMDLQRFQQVLLNYLSNALKFTGHRDSV